MPIGDELMKPRLAEQIVSFLRLARVQECDPDFRKWNERQWARTMQWLDDSGLAFYFQQRLKEREATASIPDWVSAQLESNCSLNRQRTEDLGQRFARINALFTEAGIPYAAIKGFSLVPQFCPSSPLRYQGDFDYLVDEHSLLEARTVLLSLGYTERKSRSAQETIFLSPGASAPLRNGRQYSPHSPHAVELHLDVWDASLHGLPLLPRLFSTESLSVSHVDGKAFPSLHDEDAFLLQILHACHHLFTHWIRMSCLLEIAYFMNRNAENWELWDRIDRRVGGNPLLREFTALVVGMATQLFDCPIPPQIHVWQEQLRPGPRLWVERYARDWAFGDVPVHELSFFPNSKLVLFLHQQYRDWPNSGRDPRQSRRASASRLSRILSSIRNHPASLLKRRWWKPQLLVRRTIFHAFAGIRYACETPRWHWRLRKMTVSPPDERPTVIPLRRLPPSKPL